MLRYFDLNRHDIAKTASFRSAASGRITKSMPMSHGGLPPVQPSGDAATTLSIGQQILLYVGVLIGVIFSSAVGQFKAGQVVTLEMNAANIAVSAVIALLLVPYVYKQIQPNAKAPLLVQFGLFVQHGVFWQVIFSLIGKTMG